MSPNDCSRELGKRVRSLTERGWLEIEGGQPPDSMAEFIETGFHVRFWPSGGDDCVQAREPTLEQALARMPLPKPLA